MEKQPLTYFEKLENLHVLIETRDMLTNKLKNENKPNALIDEDLGKIDKEIKSYMQGHEGQMNQMLTQSLFNPAVLQELDEQ